MDGSIEPLKFIYNNKKYSCGELITVTDNHYAGNHVKIFKFKKGKKMYELHFEMSTGKWYLNPMCNK